MTMGEYEERFRTPAPSLYQIFAAIRGPKATRRRSRRFWVAPIRNTPEPRQHALRPGVSAPPAQLPPPSPGRQRCHQVTGVCCPTHDVHSPVAGANPDLNFVLGSKRGIDQCLESALSNPVTLCLIGGSVLTAKFNNAAALASFVATGRVFALGAVMQDLQNDINSSPDPYQTGIGYGRRFCIWIGAAVAFALGGGGQGEADPAGANPLAAAPRGRLASLWLRPRWCPLPSRMPTNGCLSSPRRTAAETVVMSSWDNALGGRGIVLPGGSIHDNLPGFTRLHSGRCARERK